MPRRSDRTPPDPGADPRNRAADADADDITTDGDPIARPDLSVIPVAGLTPRRLAGAVDVLIVA